MMQQWTAWHHAWIPALVLVGCAPASSRGGDAPDGPPLAAEAVCFTATAWHEADQLFHRDPRWLGGDAASSVDLGGGRILWLFGDSWVEPRGRWNRDSAYMVSNSLGIQQGADPASASMRFYWGRMPDGTPGPIVPDEGEERHWFGNGVMAGGRLVLFLNRLRSSKDGLGFEHLGWTSWLVENPDDDPSTWVLRHLPTPTNALGVLVGFAAVRQFGDHVYALGAVETDPVKPIHAVRWTVPAVTSGDLSDPEWWAGDSLGWVADTSAVPRQPIFEQGQSELSLHRDPLTRRYLVVQTEGFGPADVMLRSAPTLTGPWTEVQQLFRPPEYSRPNAMIYSAKAHPELAGGDLVVTYSTNSFRFEEHFSDSLIYYPRFVRLTRCD